MIQEPEEYVLALACLLDALWETAPDEDKDRIAETQALTAERLCAVMAAIPDPVMR